MTLCWLGDSRAYWLGDGPGAEAKRLTTDDSLAGEMVAAGLVSEDDAMALPQAHVVTGWVGADAAGPRRTWPRSSRPAPASCCCAPTACGTTGPRRPNWPSWPCPGR